MKKVLIIEDCPELLENIKELLELSNFDVITANDGLKAVRQVQKDSPDLILCDIQIPKMNGYKVLKFVKSDQELEEVPFVFLTGFAQKKEVKEGKQAGADAYLTKPFCPQALIGQIEELL